MKMNHEHENIINHEAILRFCMPQKLRQAGNIERMQDDRTPNVMSARVEATQRQIKEEMAGLQED